MGDYALTLVDSLDAFAVSTSVAFPALCPIIVTDFCLLDHFRSWETGKDSRTACEKSSSSSTSTRTVACRCSK